MDVLLDTGELILKMMERLPKTMDYAPKPMDYAWISTEHDGIILQCYAQLPAPASICGRGGADDERARPAVRHFQ